MTRNSALRRRTRLAPLLILGVLAVFVAAPAPAAAADMTITDAELAMVNALNTDRTARGLVPVRIDTRLMAIARARSVDMATKHYFSHTQPDGRNVFNILNAKGITWYNAGEIIAKNNYGTLAQSVAGANNQWMNSPGHKAIIVSTSMNYVGVGLAIEAGTGVKFWTAVYIKGPDRTGARATAAQPQVSDGTTSTTKRVTVTWTGADVKLQVLTSGLYIFRIQRRVDGGSWVNISTGTTAKSVTYQLATNHTYEFRVAARDKAGNWGAWSTASATLKPTIGSVTATR